MATIWMLLVLIGSFAGLMFVARILVAPFSERVFEQMRRRPVLHVVWGVISVFGFYYFFVLVPAGPPNWWDRREQRKIVYERVQAAGGWQAVRKGCEMLITNTSQNYYWEPPSTGSHVYPSPPPDGPQKFHVTNIDYGPLPPAVAVLKPREITYYPPQLLRQFKDRSDVPVIHIRLFGVHSTGGHSRPYFGLQVVCGTNWPDYRPKVGHSGGVSGNSHSTYKQVADGVFEIY